MSLKEETSGEKKSHHTSMVVCAIVNDQETYFSCFQASGKTPTSSAWHWSHLANEGISVKCPALKILPSLEALYVDSQKASLLSLCWGEILIVLKPWLFLLCLDWHSPDLQLLSAPLLLHSAQAAVYLGTAVSFLACNPSSRVEKSTTGLMWTSLF